MYTYECVNNGTHFVYYQHTPITTLFCTLLILYFYITGIAVGVVSGGGVILLVLLTVVIVAIYVRRRRLKG